MADRRSLGIVGFVFGSVTAAVMLIAVMVVKQHVDGRLTLEAPHCPSSPPRLRPSSANFSANRHRRHASVTEHRGPAPHCPTGVAR